MNLRALLPLALVAAAGCTSERQPPPQPAPRPQQRPAEPPAVSTPPAPAPVGWAELPLTPGSWSYNQIGGVTSALFAATGPQEAQFILRCDRSLRRVRMLRAGASQGAAVVNIRTSYGARSFPVVEMDGPLEYVGAELPSADRFLDNMIFSRGRFSVEVAGTPTLVLPSWAEPARVVEDCRE